jgi:hypothetical protein
VDEIRMKNKPLFVRFLFVWLFLSDTVFGADQAKEIPLWPSGAPGSEGKTGKETVRVTPRIVVTKDSPPAFLVCGYKDRPDISQGLAEVYLKFRAAGISAQLHIFRQCRPRVWRAREESPGLWRLAHSLSRVAG